MSHFNHLIDVKPISNFLANSLHIKADQTINNIWIHKIIEKLSVKRLPYTLQRISALVGLLCISPLLLIVIALIRFESKGNALFMQTRVGENGKEFKLYKFRSMYQPGDKHYVDPDSLASDRDGVCKKFFNDPRITGIGKFIRKYSIDELPQLINVVKGDMVLIGPRPALPHEVAEYDQKALKRLLVKPGLTGLWQVSGRADTTFDEQIDLDIRYVEEHSLYMDLKILCLTVPAVLGAKGAY